MKVGASGMAAYCAVAIGSVDQEVLMLSNHHPCRSHNRLSTRSSMIGVVVWDREIWPP
ncbi:MAG: hypothetical protein ACQ9MH_22500 [Nitrospinales bacterium]